MTAVERVSHSNEYLQFWPGDETKLSFAQSTACHAPT